MTNPINAKYNTAVTATLLFVKLHTKSDADRISEVFDCYTNPAINDELILDFSRLCEDDDLNQQAVELFGKTMVDDLNGHLVLFHA